MIVFFTRNIAGETAFLEGEEARHAAQVLRKRPGDTVRFTDGNGGWYDGVIVSVGKEQCGISITAAEILPYRRPYRLHLAVAPTKNMERFEWFLEKATEIGVDSITPVWCRHSERAHIRPDRLRKILIAAMKQSLQPFLPSLEDAIPLDQLVRMEQTLQFRRYIAYVDSAMGKRHLCEACQPGQDTLVLIGPEGDFAAEEVASCLKADFEPVSLGSNRLRTETAGIIAAHCIAIRNEIP